MLNLVLILYPVINLAEAWLETTVIELKNPYISEYNKLNRREHFRSGVFAVLVCLVFVAIAWQLQYYALLPAILINRRLVFDYALKILRGRAFDRYEGDGFFDTIGRKIFGRTGAEKEFILLVLITLISIVYSL